MNSTGTSRAWRNGWLPECCASAGWGFKRRRPCWLLQGTSDAAAQRGATGCSVRSQPAECVVWKKLSTSAQQGRLNIALLGSERFESKPSSLRNTVSAARRLRSFAKPLIHLFYWFVQVAQFNCISVF